LVDHRVSRVTHPLSAERLRDLAARAATPRERLGPGFCPVDEAPDPARFERRMQRLRLLAGGGDEPRLARALEVAGLDDGALARGLGPSRLAPGAALPRWAEVLGEVLSGWGAEAGGTGDTADAGAPSKLPFRRVLAPLLRWAQDRLRERTGPLLDLLCEGALEGCLEQLAATLCSWAAPTLGLELTIYVRRHGGRLASLVAAGSGQTAHYDAFCRELGNGRISALFEEYPVLGRCLATLADQWVEATTELIVRLRTDRPRLDERFGRGAALGRVRALQTSLSDRHHGGRTVTALAFESGVRIVYKPKNLGTEAWFSACAAFLAAQGAPAAVRAPQVLAQDGYLWVEHIDERPCADAAAVGRYFERAGALLCLCYALEATDCHYENLIASGDTPVLVDTETLAHPRARLEDELETGDAEVHADRQLATSVLWTGLLPVWQVGRDRVHVYDVSGFTSEPGQALPVELPGWEHVNQDAMRAVLRRHRLPGARNLPVLDGRALLPTEARGEFLGGFERMYRYLAGDRDAILAPTGPVHALAACRIRFIFRATRIYGGLMLRLIDPACLRSGVDWGIEMHVLYRAATVTAKTPRFGPLIQAEIRAIERLDVPFFACAATSDSLVLDDGSALHGCFEGPSVDRVDARIRALSEDDLRLQRAYIQSSLDVRTAIRPHGREAIVAPQDLAAPALRAAMPDGGELERHARELADGLRSSAVRAPDGSLTWIAPSYLLASERFQLQRVGTGLYDGATGIAILLAAVARLFQDDRARDDALRAVQTLRRDLREPRRALRLARLGLGGGEGLGALIYGLVTLSRLLDEPALCEDAGRAAALITDEALAHDDGLDVLVGSAGALLGLVTLHEAAPSAAILERAQACARRILAGARPTPTGYRAWPGTRPRALTGFSHGAAGIAYALLRLHRVAPARALRDAAAEAIAFEDAVFAEPAGNWPDLRTQHDGVRCMCSWCHGAPGIVLARIGGASELDGDPVRRDIERGVATTIAGLVQDVDNYCCGNAGRIDVLFTAGRALRRGDLVDAAFGGVTAMLQQARRDGYRLFHELPRGTTAPGLFSGTAGVGYQLLRMVHPDQLPSVLCWS
jgi:type 2 lantibiotic biosynthesis protein LanM